METEDGCRAFALECEMLSGEEGKLDVWVCWYRIIPQQVTKDRCRSRRWYQTSDAALAVFAPCCVVENAGG